MNKIILGLLLSLTPAIVLGAQSVLELLSADDEREVSLFELTVTSNKQILDYINNKHEGKFWPFKTANIKIDCNTEKCTINGKTILNKNEWYTNLTENRRMVKVSGQNNVYSDIYIEAGKLTYEMTFTDVSSIESLVANVLGNHYFEAFYVLPENSCKIGYPTQCAGVEDFGHPWP